MSRSDERFEGKNMPTRGGKANSANLNEQPSMNQPGVAKGIDANNSTYTEMNNHNLNTDTFAAGMNADGKHDVERRSKSTNEHAQIAWEKLSTDYGLANDVPG